MKIAKVVRFGALVVLFAAPAMCVAEDSHPCEAETAKLMDVKSSWEIVYADGIALPDKCFDGYFAEGISDTLVRKMEADWPGFKSILNKHKDGKKFLRLVLRSINATLNPKDIKSLKSLAETSCNPSLGKQCNAISKRAAAAELKR
jgi:hypothetical protein